jgi:beta-glucosidase
MNTDVSSASPFGQASARVNAGASAIVEAEALVGAMTLVEKLGCLDGDTDCWPGLVDMAGGGYYKHTWPAAVVGRLGIPGIEFADGPRGAVVGPATCFPVSMARGATFDPQLEEAIGEAIGLELRTIGATFTGAVCMNLLRHPAWGRAQETYGEDPLHVGVMASAFTRGLQRNVMACAKHFALNSMENARFTVDVSCDDRSLHEVYLPHFRRVADSGVAAFMSAYNKVNGTFCGDNPALLTGVLRNEWGWEGFVITDFVFGLRDPVGSVRAGCDIEMPFRQQRFQVLPDAVDDGRLSVTDVDRAVTAIVSTLLRFGSVFDDPPDLSVLATPGHRHLARTAAVTSTVLLANRDVLPLAQDALRSVAVLGKLARIPNLGDAGSSDVHTPSVVTPLDGLREALSGVALTHSDDDASAATGTDVTVVVVGCTKYDEGEFLDQSATGELMHLLPPMGDDPIGFGALASAQEGESDGDGEFAPGGDRRTLRLSSEDEALIRGAVAAATGPVIVVVMGGSAIVMPWLDDVGAVLQIWYPGMEGGRALAEVLLGRSEPGGRLPFAIPHDEADLVDFDPDAAHVTYGLLHGQWHLDHTGTKAHRPFGFGLGYTNIEVTGGSLKDDHTVEVAVTNTGQRDGSTVVFAFGGVENTHFERPLRRLIGFERVTVLVGESITVEVPLDWSMLDVRVEGAWHTEEGRYLVQLGTSAATLPVSFLVDR